MLVVWRDGLWVEVSSSTDQLKELLTFGQTVTEYRKRDCVFYQLNYIY